MQCRTGAQCSAAETRLLCCCLVGDYPSLLQSGRLAAVAAALCMPRLRRLLKRRAGCCRPLLRHRNPPKRRWIVRDQGLETWSDLEYVSRYCRSDRQGLLGQRHGGCHANPISVDQWSALVVPSPFPVQYGTVPYRYRRLRNTADRVRPYPYYGTSTSTRIEWDRPEPPWLNKRRLLKLKLKTYKKTNIR